MKDDYLEPILQATAEELKNLVNKGLIKIIGYDPNGFPVYKNTELGNLVADELNKEEFNAKRVRRRGV